MIDHELLKPMFSFKERSWDAHTFFTKAILGVDDAVHYPEYWVMARVIDNLGEYVIPFVAFPDGVDKGFASKYNFPEGRTVLQCVSDCKFSPFILDRRFGDVMLLSSLCYAIFITIAKSTG